MVTGVEMFRKLLDEGLAGDNVGLLLRGTEKEEVERGQVLAKPGSITPHTKFKAEAYVLTKEEGGRHTPFFTGYRPQFYFRTTDVTGDVKLPTGVEMVMPGDNVSAEIALITPVALEKGLGIAHHQPGVLEADEGDKQADAGRHRGVELVGNRPQEHLPDARGGDGEEQHTGKEYCAQRGLPRDVQLDADGVSEIGVEAHARRQRDGIARHHAHENGGECGGEAGGRGDSGKGHPRIGQDGRVHQDDVGHGEEGGDAGKDLGAPVGGEALKLKIAFQGFEHRCS